jgi:tRNA nucleotidyltransferase (CCA-adding enzyme)
MKFNIPEPVCEIGEALKDAGFEAYIVGGCVRDLLLGREPKDWDIATDATPEQVQKLFSTFAGAMADKPATVYENDFGTVGIKTRPTEQGQSFGRAGSEDPKLTIVEVTTFRNEGKYTDKRHPDEVRFAKTIEEDLSRRDLTVNAMAMELAPSTSHLVPRIIDPYDGEVDLQKKMIRTVGDPDARFTEDALRLMRAVRFAVELGFTIEEKTAAAIKKHAASLKDIAAERVRDELIKIIMAPGAGRGIVLLEELGLLRYILPEMRDGIGVGQNLHHVYTVWEHNLYALEYAVKENYSLLVRMASFLHDVGKPKSKRGEGMKSTFYGHEVIGARMAVKMLDRLKFPREFVDKVAHLVRRHMFYYNVGDVSPAGVRRFLVRVGPENIDNLLKVREADRIGSGVKKAIPYKLRHLLFMIEKVKHDPVSVKMLKVSGEDVMRIADIPPSRKVGDILAALLDEVLEDPEKNTQKDLEFRIEDLAKLSEKELAALRKKAAEKQEEIEGEAEAEMKKKHRVA